MLPVHQAGQCSVAATGEIVGSKWTVLLVHDLSEGPRRFTELEHAFKFNDAVLRHLIVAMKDLLPLPFDKRLL